MANLFDIFFGEGSRPIRRDAQLRMTVDSDGNQVIKPVAGESITLSQEGSIDRLTFSPDSFYHCGCSAQLLIGGQCAEPSCRQVSCQRCFGRCSFCLKPTCLEHTRYIEMARTQQTRVCCACHNTVKRKRLFHSIFKSALRPFVGFERGND
jgi:hypothetical protein